MATDRRRSRRMARSPRRYQRGGRTRRRFQQGGHAHNSPGIKYHYHNLHDSGDKTLGAKFYDPNDGQGGGGIGVPVDHWTGVQTGAYYTDEASGLGWYHDWDPNSNNYGDPLYPQPQGTLPHHGHGSSTINPNPRGGGNTGGGTGGDLMGWSIHSGKTVRHERKRRPTQSRGRGGRVGRRRNMNTGGMIGNPTAAQQNAASPTRNTPSRKPVRGRGVGWSLGPQFPTGEYCQPWPQCQTR